ncbi:MAG: RDD family protein [Deltaproteobacteria bacterium]|nr:RDD family protein [Deltaproteobacteria bacterium]
MAEHPPENGAFGDYYPLMLPRADILERFLAKLIDFLIVGAFFAFPSVVGPLAGVTYILISDGLKSGGSLGKRIIGLRVVMLVDGGAPCGFKTSIIRNSVFGAALASFILIGWIPYLGKLLAFILLAAAVIGETVLIYTDESGSRFGDRIAGTAVVDAKGGGGQI